MRGVRVGTDVQLPRQSVTFENDGVADSFRTLTIAQFAVQPNSLLAGEVLLLELELCGQIEQAKLFLLFRNHFVQKRQVIAEEQNGRGIVHLRVSANIMIKKDRRHRRDIFMAEAQVRTRKSGVSGLDRRHADFALLVDHVSGKDLLGQRHGPGGARNRRQENFLLHARYVERKQSTVLDHLACNLVLAGGEFGDRNLFPAPNSINQREVGGSQQPEILAILLIDPLDVLGDYHANARAHLGVRRLLAARTLAAPLTAHRAYKAATLHISAADWGHTAAFQSEIRNLSQSLVKVEAVVCGGNLVGRDIVAQLRITGRILRIPGQILARQLPSDEFGIFGEK